MPPGFTQTWAERLDSVCRLRVKEATYGEPFVPGTVYVAPTGKHMRIKREGKEASVVLDMDFADSLHVPSIDILMSSMAQAYGSRALGVLLTGLGQDGALGLLALRRAGGHTIAETEDSAVAYSMPGSAVEMGAAAEEVAAVDLPSVVIDRVKGVM
jgi:two-component system chemotaxis response regulator CheB